MNSRVLAAKILVSVLQNNISLNEAFLLAEIEPLKDKNFIKELCYGTLRWYPRLNFITQKLLKKPFKKKDTDLLVIILIGLYQIIFLRVPDHAAVSEAVNAVKAFHKEWAKGLINSILRQYLRAQTELQQQIEKNDEALYSHPEWILSTIQQAWPKQWQGIIEANNDRPPFSLRVNLLHQSREEYLLRLKNLGLDAEVHSENKTGILLHNAVGVENLPGFFEGDVSIQDFTSQLVAPLLLLKPGISVLDACCAPGGKTTHILEMEPGLKKLLALDHNQDRLKKVSENLQRLNLKANLIHADATEPSKWWDGELFDRILVDAPCSAIGVIRRHPDIKILRKASDIASLAKGQLQLLESLWPLLKPHGIMLYSTCSLIPEENDHVLKAFLERHNDAKELPIQETWGENASIGKQILTSKNCDGFYFGRLEKL